MQIRGKNVLITGASRGLGEALAERLAAEGARVVLVAREPRPLEAVAKRIVDRGGVAFALAADVGETERAFALAAEAAALAGPIDILIHNASDLGPVPLELLLDTPLETFERAFLVNVLGPFALSKALVGPMVLRGEGLVVHITSDAATNAYPRWGAYGASKAALDHLSRIWAAELDGTSVQVMLIDPGEMDTRMHQDAMPEADRSTLAKPVDVASRIARTIAQGQDEEEEVHETRKKSA